MANVMESNTSGSFNINDKINQQINNAGGVYSPEFGQYDFSYRDPQQKAWTGLDVSSIVNVNRDTGNGSGSGLPGSGGGTNTAVTERQTGGVYSGGYSGGYSAPVQEKPTYTAAQLPAATSQAEYINAMYDANEQRRRAALEAEYTANVGALDRQAENIPAQYQNAANAAGAQAAINQAAFNERAAAAGLNTGAAGQAALAQNNALLAQMSTIRQNQAQALNDVESQRVSLSTQYQKAIADAIAANEADRAAALYNEAKRVDESLVNTAVNQAAENYRAWQAMYK